MQVTSTRIVNVPFDFIALVMWIATVCGPDFLDFAPLTDTLPTVHPGWFAIEM